MKPLPIPRLAGRCDGERIIGPDGREVTIGAGVLDVLLALDGHRDFAGVMERLRTQRSPLSAPEVQQVVMHAFEAGILEEPDWTALPIETLADSRYHCTSCSRSCRAFRIGPLSDADLGRLAAVDLASLGTTLEDGVCTEPGIRGETEHYLRKLDDGACIFLDRQTSRCRIHARFGERAKPLVCQVFPARLTLTPAGLRFTVRKSCQSRHSTFRTAPPLREQVDWIRSVQELGFGRSTMAFPAWVVCFPDRAVIELAPGLPISHAVFVRLEEKILAGIADRKGSLEAAVVQTIARLHTSASGALVGNRWPRGASADSKACLAHLVGLIKAQSGNLREPHLHAALDHLTAAIGGANRPTPDDLGARAPDVQELAGAFFLEDLWSLATLPQAGSYLGGIILLAIEHLLAKWLAMEMALAEGRPRIDAALLNRASYATSSLLRVLELHKPEALLHIAAAPEEVFLGGAADRVGC